MCSRRLQRKRGVGSFRTGTCGNGEHHDPPSRRRGEEPTSGSRGHQREEAWIILREAVGREAEPKNLASFICG